MNNAKRLSNDLIYLKELVGGRAGMQIALAVVMLVLGVNVYLLSRTDQAMLVPDWLHFAEGGQTVMPGVGAHLPSFTHAFAITILISAVLRPWRRLTAIVCAAWFAVACALEFGQARGVGDRISVLLSGLESPSSYLEFAAGYFVRGTYDPLDVAGIAIGCLSAYLIGHFIRNREASYGEQE